MNTLKIATSALLLSVFSFSGNAQSKPQDEVTQVSEEFSVEIKAGFTMEDLKSIENMLKKDYNIQATFENVNIVDKKINGLKMKLINGNQRISKTINNKNVPIRPFKITVTDNYDKNLIVTVEDVTDNKDRSVNITLKNDSL